MHGFRSHRFLAEREQRFPFLSHVGIASTNELFEICIRIVEISTLMLNIHEIVRQF